MSRRLQDKLIDNIDVDRMADPFDAVPHVAQGVEARADAAGLLQVRRLAPPRRSLLGPLRRALRPPTEGRINLDERGTFFWRQIDGRRNVRAVMRALAKRFGLDRSDARAATILFVKALMLRGLIHLEVDRPRADGPRETPQ